MQKLIADVLSFLRALSIWPILVFSLHGQWGWAFLFLILGWGTDLLDGWAYRRWGSFSNGRVDADGLADSVIAFGASLVPAAYIAGHDATLEPILLIGYVASVCCGILMLLAMRYPDTDPLARKVIAFNMLVFHGALQIVATTLWFAYMAAGWWLCGVTMAILGIVINRQAPKISGWLKGRLTAQEQ